MMRLLSCHVLRSGARAHRQRGMALVAVLWIIAALSIMVTGLSTTVRQQIRVASAERDRVSIQARGEAAIALAVQHMLVEPELARSGTQIDVNYDGQRMTVKLAALDGWIALNGADEGLLQIVFQIAGGLSQAEARQLTDNLLIWRDSRPEIDPTLPGANQIQPRLFESVEDLLLVPGMDFGLYERVAPLFNADLPRIRQVNVQAAPQEVLAVLTGGNAALAADYIAQRERDGELADASRFQQVYFKAESASGGGPYWRLQVESAADAGRIWVLSQDIALHAGARSATPWTVLRTRIRWR